MTYNKKKECEDEYITFLSCLLYKNVCDYILKYL